MEAVCANELGETVRWHIDLQPWASPTPSLNFEALRFLKYISTSQISCEHMNLSSLGGNSETTKKPWSVCLDERFGLIHRIRSKQCRLYSLGLGNDDNQFEISMANSGCEVHRFDPSIKSAHIQEGRHLWYHRLSVDWRDPNPAIAAHRLHSNTKKLGTILNEFGHQKSSVFTSNTSRVRTDGHKQQLRWNSAGKPRSPGSFPCPALGKKRTSAWQHLCTTAGQRFLPD
nr:probable methyltransferase-like protein 24 isoform X3 [Anser cygnoides]